MHKISWNKQQDSNTCTKYADIGRRFAAALSTRLFWKNPRSHHKGAAGRVRTGLGDRLLQVLCHCQLGQDIPIMMQQICKKRPWQEIFVKKICIHATKYAVICKEWIGTVTTCQWKMSLHRLQHAKYAKHMQKYDKKICRKCGKKYAEYAWVYVVMAQQKLIEFDSEVRVRLKVRDFSRWWSWWT